MGFDALNATHNATLRNVAGAVTTVTWGYEDEMRTAQSGGTTAIMTQNGDLMRRRRQEGATVTDWKLLASCWTTYAALCPKSP